MIANDTDLSGATMMSWIMPTFWPWSLTTGLFRINFFTLQPLMMAVETCTDTPSGWAPATCAKAAVEPKARANEVTSNATSFEFVFNPQKIWQTVAGDARFMRGCQRDCLPSLLQISCHAAQFCVQTCLSDPPL